MAIDYLCVLFTSTIIHIKRYKSHRKHSEKPQEAFAFHRVLPWTRHDCPLHYSLRSHWQATFFARARDMAEKRRLGVNTMKNPHYPHYPLLLSCGGHIFISRQVKHRKKDISLLCVWAEEGVVFGSRLKHVKTIKKDGDDWMNGYAGYLTWVNIG